MTLKEFIRSKYPNISAGEEARLFLVASEWGSRVREAVIYEQEGNLRQALIEIGWTPPPAPQQTSEKGEG
jgi:hypothetical protein